MSAAGRAWANGAAALVALVDRGEIAVDLGINPADLRLRIVEQPETVTANWLKLGTIGLAKCIEAVVTGYCDSLRALAARDAERLGVMSPEVPFDSRATKLSGAPRRVGMMRANSPK